LIRGLFSLMPRRGDLLSPDRRSCTALAYRTGVQTLLPTRLFSSWILQDHRYEMVEAMAGSRSKTRRENPLSSFWSTHPTRRRSGGPQKPFSSLSEGVRGIFTVSTEPGEIACVLHILILGTTMSSWVAGAGQYCLGPFPRNVCRNAWETVVL
jgi:hypothetical protein